MPAQGCGGDQADRADEFEDSKDHPDSPGPRTEGREVSTEFVKHEKLDDAR